MGTRREDSVVSAINDIMNLEDRRLEEESLREQQRRQQRAEEALLKREEEARLRKELEEAEKRRIEADLRQKDKEAAARITRLHSELLAVQSAREGLRLELMAARGRLAESKDNRFVRTPRILSVLTILVLVFLGGLLLGLWQGKLNEGPSVVSVDNPPVTLDSKSEEMGKAVLQPPAALESSTSATVPSLMDRPISAKEQSSAQERVSPSGKGKGRRVRTKKSDGKFDILKDFKICGDDPLCEASGKKRKKKR